MSAKKVLADLLSTGGSTSRVGYVLRRVLPQSPLDLFLGRERPGGEPVLLLQVPDETVLHSLNSITTRAFRVDTLHLPDDPVGWKSVVVKLTDDALFDEYCLVLDQLIRGLQAIRITQDAVRLLAARLHAWLLLFSPAASQMPEERQRGLAGELVVLEALATQGTGWMAALRAWTGPDRQDRDFNFPAAVIEVKTNGAGGRDQVRIANEHQLDAGPGIRLFLWVLTLSSDRGSGLTLPARVERIRTILETDPGSLVLFEERLTAANYSDLQLERMSSPALQVTSHRIYAVHGRFPRLIPADLRSGVLNVSYAIDLADCAGFLLDAQSQAALVASLET